MVVIVRNAYELYYYHPEGGREYINEFVSFMIIAGVVETLVRE